MIKKIKTSELQVGMHIHDINCSWMDHPFMKSSMKISDRDILQKVASIGASEIFIDTAKGRDVVDASEMKETEKIVHSKSEGDIIEPKKVKAVSVKAEIGRALKIKSEARKAIKNMMSDIRFGEQIKTENIENVVDNITDSVFRNPDALISLVRIRQADEYTYMHSISVCVLLTAFCKYLGVERKLIKEVSIGGLLHDIGKMKIPNEVLNKPGRLSAEEFDVIKTHVAHGINILSETPGISSISKEVVAQHHERLNGSGYPKGLKGEENSKFGQMAAIVDMYDAMTSERCYREKLQPTFVMKKLFELSKQYFNSNIVQQFIHCIGIYPVGTLIRFESGMLGLVIDRGNSDILHPVIRVIFNTKVERYVQPFDVDLGNPSGQNGKYNIVSYESPEEWKINTETYL